ncbi:unnamed protein product, partial [Urochloa humidicola]
TYSVLVTWGELIYTKDLWGSRCAVSRFHLKQEMVKGFGRVLHATK